jgi:hypothetical protein
MTDALDVDGRTSPHETDHFITFAEQKIGEIGTVLTGNAGYQRAFGHRGSSTATALTAVTTANNSTTEQM